VLHYRLAMSVQRWGILCPEERREILYMQVAKLKEAVVQVIRSLL
jgi:hypothetical protein